MPAVSVIIPAYNQGHYLRQAVQSVLDQSYDDFEIVVVDDGSTDNTREVVGLFSDPRICYVYQENQGLSAARNTGIGHASGAYLAYLDCDDLFLPRKLELQLEVLEGDRALGFVAGQAIPIDEQGNRAGHIFRVRPPEAGHRLLLGNPLHVGSVMVRREWQERAGFFDTSLRSYEDWDMWLRLARAGCRMGWVDQPVSLYRFHREQMTRDGRQMTEATFAVLEKVFSDPSLPQAWRAMREEAYSNAHIRAAAQAYRAGDYALGKQHLREAVLLNPALAENEGRLLGERMISWINLPKIRDPLRYLERIYDNLPDEVAVLRKRRARDLGRAAIRVTFDAYDRGDLALARKAVRGVLRYRPLALRNRGLLSILVRSHLNLMRQRDEGRPLAPALET